MNQLAVIDSSVIAEINSEHELAQQASKTAAEHGSRVGALLLQVKESLPHGEFGNWLVQNVNVSDRQARKYQNRLNHRLQVNCQNSSSKQVVAAV